MKSRTVDRSSPKSRVLLIAHQEDDHMNANLQPPKIDSRWGVVRRQLYGLFVRIGLLMSILFLITEILKALFAFFDQSD